MGRKSFWQYWRMIIGESANKSSKKLGLFGRVLAVLAIVIAGGILVFGRGGNLIDNLINAGATLGAWLLLWVLFFLVYLLREPMIVHNQQEQLIQSYKDKYEPEKRPVENIKLIPREDYFEDAHRPNTELCAWIEVFNGERFDIYDCELSLSSVAIPLPSGLWEEVKHKVVRDTSRFIWPQLGRDQKIVRRDGTERVNIAQNRQGITVFTFINNNYRKVEGGSPRKYKIQLRLSGKMKMPEERYIEDVIFTGFLIYEEQRQYRRLYLTEEEPT